MERAYDTYTPPRYSIVSRGIFDGLPVILPSSTKEGPTDQNCRAGCYGKNIATGCQVSGLSYSRHVPYLGDRGSFVCLCVFQHMRSGPITGICSGIRGLIRGRQTLFLLLVPDSLGFLSQFLEIPGVVIFIF